MKDVQLGEQIKSIEKKKKYFPTFRLSLFELFSVEVTFYYLKINNLFYVTVIKVVLLL